MDPDLSGSRYSLNLDLSAAKLNLEQKPVLKVTQSRAFTLKKYARKWLSEKWVKLTRERSRDLTSKSIKFLTTNLIHFKILVFLKQNFGTEILSIYSLNLA